MGGAASGRGGGGGGARLPGGAPREAAGERTARIVRELGGGLADIWVEAPPIEEVIDRVFAGERMPDSAVPA